MLNEIIKITAGNKILKVTPADYPLKIETSIYEEGRFKDVFYTVERHPVNGKQRIGKKVEVK